MRFELMSVRPGHDAATGRSGTEAEFRTRNANRDVPKPSPDRAAILVQFAAFRLSPRTAPSSRCISSNIRKPSVRNNRPTGAEPNSFSGPSVVSMRRPSSQHAPELRKHAGKTKSVDALTSMDLF
jgi:hypothetical protein